MRHAGDEMKPSYATLVLSMSVPMPEPGSEVPRAQQGRRVAGVIPPIPTSRVALIVVATRL